MKITIIFPARDFEIGKPTMPVMPLAPTLLAALTPPEHEISLFDMFYGDEIDYATGCDLVAITVRTPLAVVAYNIADKFAADGTSVVLGGPHIFAFPNEAKKHATAVANGEGEQLWPFILEDFKAVRLKDYLFSRTFNSVKKRPSLGVAMNSFFTQASLKKSFREQFKVLPK